MHRKHNLFAKCASGILSFSLIMSMIPSIPAWAEDDFSDDEYVEEAAFDTELEESSSIFYITGFTGFEKDSEGHFTDDKTKEKYSHLEAVQGTFLDDLGLPEKLELDGYWESDGPDISSTLTLEDITWKLKSDTEEYTESSPAGTYTFVPDYMDYTAWHDDLDDIVLAENVKDLTIDVTIISEDESETESESTSEFETEFSSEAETSVSTDSETEFSPEYDTSVSTDSENYTESDNSDIDIFENIDDSVIDADNQEEYKGSTESSEADGTIIINAETNESESEEQTEAVTEPHTEAATEPQTEVVTETPTELQTEAPATEMNTEADPIAENQTLSGTLVFRNSGDDTVIYQYPTDESSSVSFTADAVTTVSSIQLPCNASLANLVIKFVLSDNTAYDLTSADFSDGSTKRLSFSDGTNTYYLDIALTKANHQFDAATCQHLATCTICGATTGDYAAHVSAKNATCTKNATCSVCGTELSGTALGHDWIPATCTTPKTCSRCKATEGTALGHDLRDDWETMEESTYSSHGYQERFCHRDDCDYTETRDLNIIGNPTDNAITNLTEGASYDLKSRLTFSAYGAASENTSPINQDIRYIPSTWSIQGMAGTWLDNYSGAFSISKPGTYTVTVTFQKQVYGDGSWQNTDIADSKTVTFSVGGASTDGSNDAVRINPKTGDQTPILPFVIILVGAAVVIVVVLVLRKKKK